MFPLRINFSLDYQNLYLKVNNFFLFKTTSEKYFLCVSFFRYFLPKILGARITQSFTVYKITFKTLYFQTISLILLPPYHTDDLIYLSLMQPYACYNIWWNGSENTLKTFEHSKLLLTFRLWLYYWVICFNVIPFIPCSWTVTFFVGSQGTDICVSFCQDKSISHLTIFRVRSVSPNISLQFSNNPDRFIFSYSNWRFYISLDARPMLKDFFFWWLNKIMKDLKIGIRPYLILEKRMLVGLNTVKPSVICALFFKKIWVDFGGCANYTGIKEFWMCKDK